MKFDLPDKQLLDFFTQASTKEVSVDEYVTDLFNQLHQRIVSQKSFKIDIDHKLALSKWIVSAAFVKDTSNNIALAWTGGKDSTVLLWIVREVCKEQAIEMPEIVLINEGDMFEEIKEFVGKLSKNWAFDYTEVSNQDVLEKVEAIGDEIQISRLNKRNRKELKRVGYSKKTLIFEPESMEGNHLMKTVVQNQYLEDSNISMLLTGIRWDEQDARADERYFSERGDKHTPTHTRIHPILHFSEEDIWELIQHYSIPYCSLYEKGFRSLGAKSSTQIAENKPAWEQDMKTTTERAGRAQDKEEIMKRLRDLGYM